MKLYLAGPMRGYPNFNFPAFDHARDRLTADGHEVVSPADLDREAGYDLDRLNYLKDAEWPEFMRGATVRDVAAVTTCDAVAVLSGWQKSRGSAIEIAVARSLGLPILDAKTLQPIDTEVVAAAKQADQDAGRVQYATGAVRCDDREGVRYDLISPIGLRRLAETCHEGAVKYDDYNWEQGMPVADLANHAIAHLYAYLSGDRSEDHLAHAAWNCLGGCHSEELWPYLNEHTLRESGCRPPRPVLDV